MDAKPVDHASLPVPLDSAIRVTANVRGRSEGAEVAWSEVVEVLDAAKGIVATPDLTGYPAGTVVTVSFDIEWPNGLTTTGGA